MVKGIPITEDCSVLPIHRDTEIYCIIEHTADKLFLKQLANRLLDMPCRRFNFYGNYAHIGETTFDRVDIERGYTAGNVALTCCYYDMESLAKHLYVAVKIERHNAVVLYDDLHLYNQFLQAARKMLPWWLRFRVPKAAK